MIQGTLFFILPFLELIVSLIYRWSRLFPFLLFRPWSLLTLLITGFFVLRRVFSGLCTLTVGFTLGLLWGFLETS